MISAFLVSAFVVAIAEIGDKTQLLSLLLAARYRRPAPIIAAILLATIANHALAALAGEWVRSQIDPATLRWMLGLSFLAVAAWVLKPDRIDAETENVREGGVFLLSFCAFFLAEMGDKTQVATVVLAAQYHALAAVVLGTTAGMMAANVPAVFLGSAFAPRIPLSAVRALAALSFAVLGVLVLAGEFMR